MNVRLPETEMLAFPLLIAGMSGTMRGVRQTLTRSADQAPCTSQARDLPRSKTVHVTCEPDTDGVLVRDQLNE
jgi:hypothetical protein